jgi:hypothetical protein
VPACARSRFRTTPPPLTSATLLRIGTSVLSNELDSCMHAWQLSCKLFSRRNDPTFTAGSRPTTDEPGSFRRLQTVQAITINQAVDRQQLLRT